MPADAPRPASWAWRHRHRLGVAALLALVTAAHVGLWSSPRVPAETKLRLTLLNAAGWAVMLIPAAAVAMWARSHRRPAPFPAQADQPD